MADEKNQPSFWTTLPGILTGLAALLTAAGGLYVVLHKAAPNPPVTVSSDMKERASTQPPTAKVVEHATSQTAGSANPSPLTPAANVAKLQTVITENDGTQISVDTENLRWMPNGAIEPKLLDLTNGQKIGLDQIKVIDVLAVDNLESTVQITLTNGDTIKASLGGGTVDNGYAFEGRNSLGPFRVRTGLLKQVVFEH